MNNPAADHSGGINQVTLDASISSMSPLRYTPAGVPVLTLTLQHNTQLVEAGLMRQVQLEMSAVLIGTLAPQLAKEPLGQIKRFVGFLANRSTRGGRLSSKAELHITGYTKLFDH